jgi:hypothetical protein
MRDRIPQKKIEEFGNDSMEDIINKMLQGDTIEEARHKRFIETRKNRNKNHAR